MSKGKIVWYDLMTTDTAAAKDFYGKITGWGTQGWESDAEYTMWTVGETPIGGLMELPKEASDAGPPLTGYPISRPTMWTTPYLKLRNLAGVSSNQQWTFPQ